MKTFIYSIFLSHYRAANIHLMYGPEGNSFVFPRVLMFPETKLR